MPKAMLLWACFFLCGVFTHAVDKNTVCEGAACEDPNTWMEDETPGLEMLQMKSMTGVGEEEGEYAENYSDYNADDADAQLDGPPNCGSYCKNSEYKEMTQVLECKLASGGTLKVLVKARSWIKNMGRYVEWVNPHEMKNLKCEPRSKTHPKLKHWMDVKGWMTFSYPSIVSKSKTVYKDINPVKYNLCRCAKGGKCTDGGSAYVSLSMEDTFVRCYTSPSADDQIALEGCPDGYEQLGQVGDDVPGCGIGNSCARLRNLNDCKKRCDKESKCGSFEWSVPKRRCGMNTVANSVTSKQTGKWGGSITCKKTR
jgi:hypothetical protein